MGDSLVSASDGPILATRRKDGSIAILIWYLIPQPKGQRSASGDPTKQTSRAFSSEGASQTFVFKFPSVHKHVKGRLSRVDEDHGNPQAPYRKMVSPAYPTMQQIAELKHETELGKPETVHLDAGGQITISIPPNGVALLELGAAARQIVDGKR